MNKIFANVCPKCVWLFLCDDTGGCAREVKSQERKKKKLAYRCLFFFLTVENLVLEHFKSNLFRGKLNSKNKQWERNLSDENLDEKAFFTASP